MKSMKKLDQYNKQSHSYSFKKSNVSFNSIPLPSRNFSMQIDYLQKKPAIRSANSSPDKTAFMEKYSKARAALDIFKIFSAPHFSLAFRFLDAPDIAHLRLVCKKMNSAVLCYITEVDVIQKVKEENLMKAKEKIEQANTKAIDEYLHLERKRKTFSGLFRSIDNSLDNLSNCRSPPDQIQSLIRMLHVIVTDYKFLDERPLDCRIDEIRNEMFRLKDYDVGELTSEKCDAIKEIYQTEEVRYEELVKYSSVWGNLLLMVMVLLDKWELRENQPCILEYEDIIRKIRIGLLKNSSYKRFAQIAKRNSLKRY